MKNELMRVEYTVEERKDNFLDYLAVCNKNHLKVCNCQRELYKNFLAKEFNEYVLNGEVLAREKNFPENEIKILKESGLRIAQEKALEKLGNYCLFYEIVCREEYELLTETLRLFRQKYDTKDIRVYMILRSVISNQLTAHRMQKESNKRGVMWSRIDRDGNEILYLNPAETEKRKFNDSVVTAIEKLDIIIEGHKNVNVNLDIPEALDIRELYGGGKNNRTEK